MNTVQQEFKHLFSPGMIGNIEIKNRIVFSAALVRF